MLVDVDLEICFSQCVVVSGCPYKYELKRNGLGYMNGREEFKDRHNAKLIYLLDVLGEPLPELEDLAKLPPVILSYLDGATPNELRALLIEVVGRWDAFKSQND
ncbi:hypothetical protein JD969_01150 [Planctomycetota bacterium]|nr:hypothetical protein JD969_01150 [Planctomycetota bacterium]